MDPWTDRLSEYLDGEIESAERAVIEQHLVSCDTCRALLEDLRAVSARASKLAPRLPAADLWPGVERRVAQLRPVRRTITFSVAQLAAAAVLLMALSGGAVWLLRAPAGQPQTTTAATTTAASRQRPATTVPVSLADETYDQAVADLQRALERDRAHLDPDTVRIIENNLRAIDEAIAQAHRALEADPSNTYLNGHLADARRRKLALLRSVNGMADPEG